MDNNNVGWNFPGNNHGQTIGISEAGIETFKGSLISSLTREICQNSLDAIKDKSKPVKIEFELDEVKSKLNPGYEELKDAIKRCLEFWTENYNEKTINFFKTALDSINNDFITILRISDYNTTGLTGSDKEFNTPWQNLVKSNGVSDKGGVYGGSFGIGKSAPFACSSIRTVFYRTLDENNLKAVQGISRLVSFRKKNSDLSSEITTGIGYYGEKERNSSIEKLQFFDNINWREEIGTDLFVMGFNCEQNWQKQIVIELLEGFMLSFLNGLLEVKVGELLINKDSLGEIIKKYKDYAKFASDYYNVMISNDAEEFSEEFESMGTLKLRVLLEDGLNRNVLISRSNGMKLFDKNRISSNIQFSAVFNMEGEELNSFFRKMESPQHNAWEIDRHDNASKAKNIRNKLYSWIKGKILELGKYGGKDELDAEGIGELIPDFFDFENNKEGNKKEEVISDKTNDWEVKILEKPIQANNISSKGNIKSKDIEDDFGDLDDDGKYESIDIPKGPSNNSNNGEGAPATAGNGDGNRPIKKYKEIQTKRIRMFVSDINKSEYTLSFMTDCNITNGYLEIKIAGEQSSIDVIIKNANNMSSSNNNIKHVENRIYISNILKNARNKVSFSLEDNELYPLEVKLYASTI